MKGKRDVALLAILVACGLRRHEAVELNVSHLQQREDHWAIVDLIGKASHIRTIPVPDWVKNLVDDWLQSAGISNGRIFRRVTRAGTVWGSGLTEKLFGTLSGNMQEKPASTNLHRTISGVLAPGSVIRPAVTRPDSVSTWTRVRPVNGTIPWLQTADSQRRQQSNRDTAEIPNGFGRLVEGLPTTLEQIEIKRSPLARTATPAALRDANSAEAQNSVFTARSDRL
jgi:hypothetical protein